MGGQIMGNMYLWVVILIIFSIVIGTFEAKIKGKFGEASVSKLLHRLDKNKYKVINDVILYSDGGNTKTTQIDHIVVSNYGIFSIETKNYKGQIYGSEQSSQWTQNIYGHKYKFMNPVHQNYVHIKAIKALLDTNGYDKIPMYSIVTFPGDAIIKVETRESYVVKWKKIVPTIKKLSSTECLNSETVEKIVELLKEKVASKVDTKEHIQEVKTTIKETKKKIKAGTCPKCGGELVLRKGKYGKFYGCSNYPKCRFTVTK